MTLKSHYKILKNISERLIASIYNISIKFRQLKFIIFCNIPFPNYFIVLMKRTNIIINEYTANITLIFQFPIVVIKIKAYNNCL